MARVVTPGGRVGDDASLDRSPRQNWVEQRGGLPRYVRIVANALMRKRGFTREHAIRTAINAMRKWAAKSKTPAVKAAAAGGAAEWESLKLSVQDVAEVLDLALEGDDHRRELVLNLSTATAARATVRGHYPPETLTWMRSAKWARADVPLSQVTRKARPDEPRNPRKVRAIAHKLRGGAPMKPVLLVARPGKPHDIADGYHRVEAHRRVGSKTIPAYVAHGAGASGPWQHEMHARKLNLAGPEPEVVLDLANDYTGAAGGTTTSGQAQATTGGSNSDFESKHPRSHGKFAPKGTASTGGGQAKLTPQQSQQIAQYQREHGLPVTGQLDETTANYAKGGKARRYAESLAKKGKKGGGGGGSADAAAKAAEAEAKKRAAEAARVAKQQQMEAARKKREQAAAVKAMEQARIRRDKAAAAAASRKAAEARAEMNALLANAARLRQQTAAASTIAAQTVATAQYAPGVV